MPLHTPVVLFALEFEHKNLRLSSVTRYRSGNRSALYIGGADGHRVVFAYKKHFVEDDRRSFLETEGLDLL